MDRTVVELFAGVGGFRCGLNHVKEIDENGKANEKEGKWDFIWANQWEPSTKSQAAFECYVERFGFKSPEKDDISNEDIASVNHKNIPNHTLLVGGFPCQDYSVARSLSNEKGIEGKKGVLWWEITKVLDAKEPPFVLLENVDRLLRSPSNQRGRDFGVMLKSFLDRGYAVEWRVINAAEYGFPQRRRRIFIFAYHKSTNYFKRMSKCLAKDLIFDEGLFAEAFPIEKEYLDAKDTNIYSLDIVDDISKKFQFHFFNAGRMLYGDIRTYKVKANFEGEECTLGELLEADFDEKYLVPKEKLKKWKDAKGSKKVDRVKPNGEPYKFSEGSVAFPDRLDRPARTMLTSEGTTNRSSHIIGVDKEKNIYRILTPIEAERIQMFPDNWTNIESKAMTERRRYFMMGNALVVGVVERLGKYLEKIVEDEN